MSREVASPTRKRGGDNIAGKAPKCAFVPRNTPPGPSNVSSRYPYFLHEIEKALPILREEAGKEPKTPPRVEVKLYPQLQSELDEIRRKNGAIHSQLLREIHSVFGICEREDGNVLRIALNHHGLEGCCTTCTAQSLH